MGDKEHVQHVLLDPNHDSEKGKLFGEYSKRCSGWQTSWILPEDSAAVAAPDTRPRLYTLVCFANNKQWDFYFFPNKM